MWNLTIGADPVGKGRPRATMRGGFVHLYTPAATKTFEAAIAEGARDLFAGDPPIGAPVSVSVVAVSRRPGRLRRRRDPPGLIPKPTRPDADNILKAILDGLVTGGALADDAIVVDARISKFWAEKTGSPRVTIRIELRS